MSANKPHCRLVKPQPVFIGKQGLSYQVGVSKEAVDSQHIHMQLATIPPRSQAKAHKHEHHETAIYALSGTSSVLYGDALEHFLELPAGSFLYIPMDTPHLPYNNTDEPAVVIISRTDPNEQESVVMMPELDRDVL
ncbi:MULTISPECIES: cupin domain-containing protein [Enterobacteriaceae]|uniref:cupin domain-containing protein n=1 Tax=Enterobacteriaceae TaxID=543 RepID=UPI000272A4D4|nr:MULTISPECIES: cupin domain-containing protein [Enterobacteriaceae]EJF31126.1 mannose-6-phosphate isomerase [Enterobacter sp. Ag1]NIF33685.1 cupin domain-containing protein [Enterobacter sp. Cy-643]NIF49974.1 cupin domain-containing protein [Enterobacter sp. Ap-1006]